MPLPPKAPIAAAFLAALATVGLGQGGPNGELPPLFSEVIEVRVVNLEIVVTDRQGNRVPGLRAEDFRLRVDGQEVPIEYFNEIFGGEAVDRSEEDQTAGVPSLVPGRPVTTNYLVFIDDYFAIHQDRNLVLKKLQEDLTFMRPDDRMAIVAFNGSDLEMLASWTSSQSELQRALRSAAGRPTHGLDRLAEQRTHDLERRDRRRLATTTADRIEAAGGIAPRGEVLADLEPIERSYAERLAKQVERSVLGAVSTLRSFAKPPGRKVMLLLSGGWPFSPVEFAVSDFDATVEEAAGAAFEQGIKGRKALFAPLADTANLLGYTIYPIDVPGMRRASGTDASRSAEDTQVGATFGFLPREEQLHNGLLFLAGDTGGQALLNAQRLAPLKLVAEDTRSYYWLGFSPQRQDDDSRHRIEVEVVGHKGLRVRTREGFVDLSRQSEVTMMVESSLLFGNPPSDKPLQLVFGKPRRAGRGKMSIHLEVGVPMEHIDLLETQGRFVNELEIRTTVMDAHGDRSETPIDTIAINGSRPPRPGDLMWYETELTLRRRPQRLVVAVYDPISGAILSSTAELKP